MPKRPAVTARGIVRVLEKAGFSFVRQKGSHQIYVRGNQAVVVPYHNKDLRKRTLRHIIKQSGMTPKEFLNLF
ncbi:MAG: type II toxin-antitoxin system HicA family toxin [Candidatus Sungbacteria bacterium]|nr:type II toxin-antitoxin system HicA family toxin [Candidatus Sungbacteria bacterium]